MKEGMHVSCMGWREGVDLGAVGEMVAESVSNVLRKERVDMDQYESGLVKIDGEAGGKSEIIENISYDDCRINRFMSDDEGVIRILENCWREVQVNRLIEQVWGVCMHDHALKQVSDDDEDIRGDMVSLSKTILQLI